MNHFLVGAVLQPEDDLVADSIESQALKYASQLSGGDAELVERLGVTMAGFQEWIRGTRYLPDDKLLEVLDIILSAHSRQKQDN